MQIVIDANVLFAALIKASNTRKILIRSDYEFFAPDFIIQEFKENIFELVKKTGLNEKELTKLFESLVNYSSLKIISAEEFINEENLKEFISLDKKDSAYLSLALHLNCVFWSNDKQLKKQDKVKVITTKELIEEFLEE